MAGKFSRASAENAADVQETIADKSRGDQRFTTIFQVSCREPAIVFCCGTRG